MKLYHCTSSAAGMLTLLSLLMLAQPLTGNSYDRSFTLEISEDFSSYVNEIVDTYRNTIDEILSVSSDARTFDNMLKPWFALTSKLASERVVLEDWRKSGKNEIGSHIFEDFFSFLSNEISQNIELHNTLIEFAKEAIEIHELNSYQQYLTKRFLENCTNGEKHIDHDFFYLEGSSGERKDETLDFTLLNLTTKSSKRNQIPNLAKKILSIDVDIICLQDLFLEESLPNLFDCLKTRYGHFYVFLNPVVPGESFSLLNNPNKLLIMSKYPLENIGFQQFTSLSSDSKDGFFDFLIKNEETVLAHVYSKNLDFNSEENSQTKLLDQILEKMQSDFLQSDKPIPFVLLGDFEIPENSIATACDLNEAYFTIDNANDPTNHALLLQSLSLLSQERFLKRYVIKIEEISIFDYRTDLLISIKDSNEYDIYSQLKAINDSYFKENPIIICKDDNSTDQEKEDKDSERENRVGIGGRASTDGSKRVDGHFSTSKRNNDGGSSDFRVSGGVSQDKDGNTKGDVRFDYDHRW